MSKVYHYFEVALIVVSFATVACLKIEPKRKGTPPNLHAEMVAPPHDLVGGHSGQSASIDSRIKVNDPQKTDRPIPLSR